MIAQAVCYKAVQELFLVFRVPTDDSAITDPLLTNYGPPIPIIVLSSVVDTTTQNYHPPALFTTLH